jgi:branched-chain amino acid transport system ATP-binding protein
MASENLLEMRDIRAGYGMSTVLDGVDLDVGRGEVVALLGANGVGKTTLLRVATGVLSARAGSVVFQGQNITGLPAHKVARLGIGQVPEGRGIFPGLTVAENLSLAGFARPQDRVESAAVDVHDLFPILAQRAAQRGETLSGGEQQMVAVARALSMRPVLLVLDEPSLGMAPLVVQTLFDALGKVRQAGMSMLIAEQAAHQAIGIADRVYVLGPGGRVVADGAASSFTDSGEIFESYMS